jgi:putative transposase
MNVHIALGVNMSGQKELPGMRIAETEGSKFRAQVLSEISGRGVRDVFVFRVDGLTGFPQAIKGVFPNADPTCKDVSAAVYQYFGVNIF